MPGVLVESSTSPPPGFFPLALSSSSSSSIACFDSSGSIDAHSPRADPTPPSPLSPISHLPFLDPLGSCPPSPSFRSRDTVQRFLPKSNLGLGLYDYLTEFFLESSSELGGFRIPPPKNGVRTNGSVDSIRSPLFSDSNGVGSPIFSDAFSALHKFLPSNTNDDESWPANTFPATDAYSCDEFRMYEFKVRRCMRGRSHDWTECPFAHPGEKARRRDPRRIHYSGSACPDFRKGSCKRGDACEFAHGVFECWLHPARYRTQPCKDGRSCRRRVCFFAHTVEQLRVLPSASSAVTSSNTGMCNSRNLFSSFDGSSSRQVSTGSLFENADAECSTFKEGKRFLEPCPPRKAMDVNGFGSGGYSAALSSASALPTYLVASLPARSPPLTPSTSPPMSPEACWQRNLGSKMQNLNKTRLLSTSPTPLHRRHLNRLQTMPTVSVPSDVGDYAADVSTLDDMGFSLPVSAHLHSAHGNSVRELQHSLQTLQFCSRITELQTSFSTPSSPQSLRYLTPYQSPLGQRLYSSIPGSPNSGSMWDLSLDSSVETDSPRRVESGRDLRAEIYGKIGKENGVDCNQDPCLGWVNDLVE